MEFTRENILKMSSGKELDELIVEKVLEWKLIEKETVFENQHYSSIYKFWVKSNGHLISNDKFSPSTNILDSFEVIEQFDNYNIFGGVSELHSCYLNGSIAQGETLPLAICRAALLSKINM